MSSGLSSLCEDCADDAFCRQHALHKRRTSNYLQVPSGFVQQAGGLLLLVLNAATLKFPASSNYSRQKKTRNELIKYLSH